VVVAQRLLDRGGHERRIGRQRGVHVREVDQRLEPEIDQVRRRLGARDQQRLAQRADLAAREPLGAVLRREQIRQQVGARRRAALSSSVSR
jgi:hypothetical protein